MTANHADGCPAIADVRDGCSCLLRGVAAQGHLPECSANEARLVPGAATGQQGTGYPVDYGTTVLGIGYGPCICDRLRACEARVREEEQAAATLEIAHKTDEHYAYGRADALTQMLDAGNVMGQEFYAKGYLAGLDAATEAVADRLVASDWDHGSNGDGIHLALTAIAALKEERP